MRPLSANPDKRKTFFHKDFVHVAGVEPADVEALSPRFVPVSNLGGTRF
jgi:hypothetical protein